MFIPQQTMVPHTADLIQTLSTWVTMLQLIIYSHNGPPKKRKQVQQPGCTVSSPPRWAKTQLKFKDTRPDRFQAAGLQCGLLGAFLLLMISHQNQNFKKATEILCQHLPFTLKNDPKMSLISHVDTKFRAPSYFSLARIIVSVSSSISKHLGRN